MTDFDPAAALAAAAEGDQKAWNAIVTTYSSLVWSIARGFRLSTADAGDVVQGTWLRLVEHLHDIRDAERLPGWLATTARREALNLIRRAGRDLPVDDVDGLGAAAVAPAVDERLLRDESQRVLWQAVSRLSHGCQRLLRVMFADPAPSYETVGAALDIPIGSIGPTRARCLAGLRSIMTD
ncbi:RNA polymerase sigma factor [Dactylosporangium siamense]|uniref:RNA polymerase sigma factor n=1 Tax=Dactylosporangium siamense TaxID=685454 RepID=A0A919PJN7_9ACTN|nr:sigma-70 family RNA polymerase sigma factor [Dactylosporangium siamense]GIG45382.1 RNA polymerase sigma factor [Dactylosporangium siamense]